MGQTAEERSKYTTGRKKLRQRDSFVYPGGAVYGGGDSEVDIRRRIQAVADAWRNGSWEMYIGSSKRTRIKPEYLYGLDTFAMMEKTIREIHVWIIG